MDLGVAVFFDLITVPLCTYLLLRYGRLRHSHPATIYLFFHFTSFTLRAWGVLGGAATVFSTWGAAFSGVRPDEIGRALVLADAALIAMTLAWLYAARQASTHQETRSRDDKSIPLSIKHIQMVAVVAIPVGVVGLAALGRIPGSSAALVDSGSISGYLGITKTWLGLSILALIYWYGFRWKLMVPMLAYILFMAIQGSQRNLAILPALLLIQIYLDRTGRRWPTLRVAVLLVALFFLAYPLKEIGAAVQAGSDPGSIATTIQQSTGDVFVGNASDQQFLDQYASTLTLLDERGVLYYGRPYLALITLPIPHQWWPEKPGLADFQKDFSTPWRPMAQTGMIVTFLGEAYANFWYPGIIVIPFLLAYLLARIYFRVYSAGYYTLSRFLYLLVAVNLIQVYRDGLNSLVVFTLVNMMPLTVMAVLHFVLPNESIAATSDKLPALDTSSPLLRSPARRV